jgi:hypothetical protein
LFSELNHPALPSPCPMPCLPVLPLLKLQGRWRVQPGEQVSKVRLEDRDRAPLL